MKNKNETANELDLDQLENVSGGARWDPQKAIVDTYVCEQCGAVFISPVALGKHMNDKHAQKITRF